MPVEGKIRSYHKKYNFAIEIAGLEIAYFTTCSAIKVEISVVEQHEAGVANVADQSPGKVKFNPVTLTAGVTDNSELYDWTQEVLNAASNSGEINDDYKKDIHIVQKNRDKSEMNRWRLHRAWPISYEVGDWDAGSDENVMESVELTYLWAEIVKR